MAEENFYGIWQVRDTSGTLFGHGTTITVQADLGITFDPPAGEAPWAKYNPVLDALEIYGLAGTKIMYVSHYMDVEQSFYAIYGLALMYGTDGAAGFRKAVFMAQREVLIEGGGVSSLREVDASTFANTDPFVVKTTTGAQFGKASHIKIIDNGDDSCHVNIENATKDPAGTATNMAFDSDVCALKGPLDNSEVIFQISQFSIETGDSTMQHIYGLSVVGDPEEAGAWGGDDDPGGGDVDPEDRR